MISSARKGALSMVAASICWSLGGLCLKYIPWGAMSIVGIRALLAAITFVIYKRSFKISFTRGNIITALCLSATTVLFVFANKQTTAAAAILLQFTAPIFIILIQFMFYKTKPKPSELTAVFVTICGMILFFLDRLDGGGFMGNIFAIASGLSFAGVFVCNKRPDTNPEQAILLGFLINILIGIPFAVFEAANPSMWLEPNAWTSLTVWFFAAILGIVQVGCAYIFFTIGIKKTPALLGCLITAMEPVLNPVWVALATPERPGKFAIIGGIVIISTVVCYNIWVENNSKFIKEGAKS